MTSTWRLVGRPVRRLILILVCTLLLGVILVIGILTWSGTDLIGGRRKCHLAPLPLPLAPSDPSPLSKKQQTLLISLQRLQSFRQRYESMLAPFLVARQDNMSWTGRFLLEPLTLQFRAWKALEDLLLDGPSKWIQAGLLETINFSAPDPQGVLSSAYLQERFRTVAHGCSLAAADLQQTVLDLEDVRNEATQRSLERTASAAEQNQTDSHSLTNRTLGSDTPLSWIETVKHDLGDLINQLETSNDADPDIRRQHRAGAQLETVLVAGDHAASSGSRSFPFWSPFSSSSSLVSFNIPWALLDTQGNRYALSRPANPALASEDTHMIEEVCLLLVTGLFLGWIVQRGLGLPVMVGHLLGGVLLGFSCLDRISSLVAVQSLGQLALLLLIYRLGTQGAEKGRIMPTGDVLAPNPSPAWIMLGLGTILATLVSGICSVFMLFLGSLFFEVPLLQAAISGLILSFSSTIVAAGTIGGLIGGETIFMGVLLAQDGLLCLSLSLLPLLPSGAGTAIIHNLAGNLAKLVLLLGGLYLVQRFCPDKLFPSDAGGKFVLSSFIAWLAYTLAGINLEMALFITSLQINGETRKVQDSAVSSTPNEQSHVSPQPHDLASLFFFASIGLLLDLRFLVRELALLLVLTACVMAAKFLLLLSIFIVVPRRQEYSAITAAVGPAPSPAYMALAMCQVSELALMLGMRARHLRLISAECYYLLAGITALSLMVNPLLVKGLGKGPNHATENIIGDLVMMGDGQGKEYG